MKVGMDIRNGKSFIDLIVVLTAESHPIYLQLNTPTVVMFRGAK